MNNIGIFWYTSVIQLFVFHESWDFVFHEIKQLVFNESIRTGAIKQLVFNESIRTGAIKQFKLQEFLWQAL